MTEFISAPCTTLLVEPDDAKAEEATRVLKQFPNATVERVRTQAEAADTLLNSPPSKYDQVYIEDQVWTPLQALEMWGLI